MRHFQIKFFRFIYLQALAIVAVSFFVGCSHKINSYDLLKSLEQAVRDNSYFYEQDPVFSAEAFQKAAKVIDSNFNGQLGDDPILFLSNQIAKKEEDQQQELIRTVCNTLLQETSPDNDSRRNYYVSPSTVDRLTNEEFNGGAGIVLFQSKFGHFQVVDILEGSGANLAGIPIGGELEKINSQTVSNLSLEDVVGLIRGPVGSSIELTISDKPYTIVRGKFSFQSTRKSEWLLNDKRYIYLEVRSANKGATREIESIIMRSNNPDGLILDLRKLNQGDFEEAFKIADLFVSEHTLGVIRRKLIAERKFSANPDVIYTGKIYVLVSGQSSPHARTIAMGMRRSTQVQFIGPNLSLLAFAGIEVPLSSGKETSSQLNGYAMIVNAVIQPDTDQSKQLNPEWLIDNSLSLSPPASKPNENDPYHKKLIDIL